MKQKKTIVSDGGEFTRVPINVWSEER